MKAKKKKYKAGGKIDAALRAELKKKTTKAKPAVKIKDTPMERINNTGVKGHDFARDAIGKAVKEKHLASLDIKTPANTGAKTYGQLADSVEKKYNKGGKVDPTKKMKKADESEIDRRYESTVGRDSRTGNLNYPNSVDMDKVDSTKGAAGNPDKLRAAISDQYYREQRKNMGIDKIKTYRKGGGLYEKFEEKANKGNNAAKYLETGKGPDGMPLSARTRAMYKAIVKKNKNVHLMSPAPFEDDGVRKGGGKMPSYKKGKK